MTWRQRLAAPRPFSTPSPAGTGRKIELAPGAFDPLSRWPKMAGGPGGSRTPTAFAAVLQPAASPFPRQARRLRTQVSNTKPRPGPDVLDSRRRGIGDPGWRQVGVSRRSRDGTDQGQADKAAQWGRQPLPRRDGRWHARYTIVDPETGQRVRRSLYGATEQEARANLTRALDAPGRGGLPLLRGRAPTLAEHGRRWLGQCRVRPKTLHRYAELLRYALPSLGHLQLTKLEAHHVGTLLTRLRDGGLSARTCNHVRSVLRNLLNQAKREGLVQRNVAELARPLPLEDVREGTTLSAEQVRMLLSVAEHHRDGPLWVLALATGARQSELVGLRWSDVDLERGTVTISRTLQPTPRSQREEHGEWLEQPTKTRRSRRTIPLASIAHGGAPSPAEAAGRGAAGGRKQLARRAW